MSSGEERKVWLHRKPDLRLSRVLQTVSWILTAAVLILVGLMRQPDLKVPLPEGVNLRFLPAVHAVLNATVAVLLLFALSAVRRGRIREHRRLMLTAMGISVLFLLGYVSYHFTYPETLYGDVNHDAELSLEELQDVSIKRPIYIVLLITHIIAAGISLPMILLAFSAAWSSRFEAHRRLARWVFPIWLYVAITGPVCYLMLRPYYS